MLLATVSMLTGLAMVASTAAILGLTVWSIARSDRRA